MNSIRCATGKDGVPTRSTKVWSDSELMENRRKLILSIRAHRMHSFVRKDRIIVRKKNAKYGYDSTEDSSFDGYSSWDSYTWTETSSVDEFEYMTNEAGIGDEDDESTESRQMSSVHDASSRDDLTKLVYLKTCKQLCIPPLVSIVTGLKGPVLDIKHTSVGPALVNNCTVTDLRLIDTDCGDIGAENFGQILPANAYLTNLTLSDTCITTRGLTALMEGLRHNKSIDYLNLSGNQLCDKSASVLAEYLQKHVRLEYLDLSHNQISVPGAEALGKAIRVNTTLEYLDLGWNHIRLRGAVAIADGIRLNQSVHTLKLGWNGFSYAGSMAMARALSQNSTLEYLDLTNNRINLDCLVYLVKGVKANAKLKTLKIDLNPITSDGATYIMDAILQNNSVQIEVLDISSQTVNRLFVKKLDALKQRRQFTAHYGIVLQQDDITLDSECFLDEDPMAVLMEYMRHNNLRLVDLFKKLDTDNNFFLSREELRNGFLKVNIPLSSKSLDKLLDDLDLNGDKQIDLSELMQGLKGHRRKMRRAKEKMEKERKLRTKQGKQLDDFLNQEDDSSRISRTMQALMTNRALYERQETGSEVADEGRNMLMLEDPDQAKLVEMSRKVQSLLVDKKDRSQTSGDENRRPRSKLMTLTASDSPRTIQRKVSKPGERLSKTAAQPKSRVASPRKSTHQSNSEKEKSSLSSVMNRRVASRDASSSTKTRDPIRIARASTTLGLPGIEKGRSLGVPSHTVGEKGRNQKGTERLNKTSANRTKTAGKRLRLKPMTQSTPSDKPSPD